ncbi:pyridoxamine 5'-phosphate oxidase family protein [Sphingobium sp. AS12]|uniref:pyridoxamine 5'-phosphate oxidase family protein n=1 Tax=Sphingobium sp. AS12 TaxID=2849495 RepID=UPI001C3134CD|nr:pyridoxamine 5'-phosphate oxidase family protein [Sphingobium sp. AS12]MBV2149842.1 pyridoxamine 5'-phosphate oxidase family protein [Sphingobium sp. AS12]
MNVDRRRAMITATLAALVASPAKALAQSRVPLLYRIAEVQAVLAAARALVTTDVLATFVTVDAEGRPRARTVLVSPPDDDLTLWIGTRGGSRKLDQLGQNPAATLHFSDDANGAYASLMGEARVYRDEAVIAVKNPYKGEELQAFFPNFPRDFVLLGFRPTWIEVMAKGLPGTAETWQPQGLAVA